MAVNDKHIKKMTLIEQRRLVYQPRKGVKS